MRIRTLGIAVILCAGAFSAPGQAKVVKAANNHFTLHHEMTSSLPPSEMWERVIRPETWWLGDHSYSGDAANLSLDARAGGLWREDWEGGSVSHGVVLRVINGKELVLDAPFGPMQTMAVSAVWTIKVEPHEDGSKVIFHEVVNGTKASKLKRLAKAVDGVKELALKNLVGNSPK